VVNQGKLQTALMRFFSLDQTIDHPIKLVEIALSAPVAVWP